MDTLKNIIGQVIDFINQVGVPLIFAIAFVVFLFGVFRYYIAGGANPEKRKEGTKLIVFSLLGFAIMIAVWGLVNLIVGILGFTNTNRPALPTFGNTSSSNTNTNTIQTSPSPQNSTTQNPATSPTLTSPTAGTNRSGPLIGPRP